MASSSRNDKKRTPTIASLSIGLNVAVGIGGFTYLGYWLDKKQETAFWIFVGLALGLFYLGYEIWKLIKDTNDQHKRSI